MSYHKYKKFIAYRKAPYSEKNEKTSTKIYKMKPVPVTESQEKAEQPTEIEEVVNEDRETEECLQSRLPNLSQGFYAMAVPLKKRELRKTMDVLEVEEFLEFPKKKRICRKKMEEDAPFEPHLQEGIMDEKLSESDIEVDLEEEEDIGLPIFEVDSFNLYTPMFGGRRKYPPTVILSAGEEEFGMFPPYKLKMRLRFKKSLNGMNPDAEKPSKKSLKCFQLYLQGASGARIPLPREKEPLVEKDGDDKELKYWDYLFYIPSTSSGDGVGITPSNGKKGKGGGGEKVAMYKFVLRWEPVARESRLHVRKRTRKLKAMDVYTSMDVLVKTKTQPRSRKKEIVFTQDEVDKIARGAKRKKVMLAERNKYVLYDEFANAGDALVKYFKARVEVISDDNGLEMPTTKKEKYALFKMLGRYLEENFKQFPYISRAKKKVVVSFTKTQTVMTFCSTNKMLMENRLKKFRKHMKFKIRGGTKRINVGTVQLKKKRRRRKAIIDDEEDFVDEYYN